MAFAPARRTFDDLRLRLHGWRDRLLASPDFQRLASAVPLVRGIARRRARAVFDLCAGFVYSQVLYACVKLGVLAAVRDGPETLGQLAAHAGLSEDAARRLMNAAASLELLERRGDDRWGLGPAGATVVGNPAILSMIEHHALFYQDLADPVALLRGEHRETALADYWAYARNANPSDLAVDQTAPYTRLMSVSQPLIASAVLDHYPLSRHRCLLDVGGGDGSFLVAAAARVPHLSLVLFDIPAVAAQARDRLDASGLAERARVVGGDFFRQPLPKGADVASLIRVLHDHDVDAVLEILRAVREALPPDGTLIVAEPMAGVSGTEPMADAYFGFYLLAMGSGRARTHQELEHLLHVAGYRHVRRIGTNLPLQGSLLIARRQTV